MGATLRLLRAVEDCAAWVGGMAGRGRFAGAELVRCLTVFVRSPCSRQAATGYWDSDWIHGVTLQYLSLRCLPEEGECDLKCLLYMGPNMGHISDMCDDD